MLIKKIFSWPNLVSFLLVLIVVGSSIVDIRSKGNHLAETKLVQEVRIISESSSKFNFKYKIWANGNNWYLLSDEKLEIGRKYILEAKVRPVQANSDFNIDNWYLSNGVEAELILEKVLLQDQNCDWHCLILAQTHNTKLFIKKTYDRLACGTFNDINTIFQNQCQNISAWSVGLTIGGTGGFTEEIKDSIKQLGFTHLVAVSGFQIGLIASFLEFFTRRLNLRRSLRILITVSGYLVLIGLVGPEAPVLRSAVSSALSIAVLYFLGRQIQVWRALVYSAIILLIFRPGFIVSYSFWLSFTTSLGLVLTSGYEIEQLAWMNKISEVAKASFSSFIFSLPLIISLNGLISPLSIVANIVIVPLIPIITILNLLSLIPIVNWFAGPIVILLQNVLTWSATTLKGYAWQIEFEKLKVEEVILFYILLLLTFVGLNLLKEQRIDKLEQSI